MPPVVQDETLFTMRPDASASPQHDITFLHFDFIVIQVAGWLIEPALVIGIIV
jgi:hypothetical protein